MIAPTPRGRQTIVSTAAPPCGPPTCGPTSLATRLAKRTTLPRCPLAPLPPTRIISASPIAAPLQPLPAEPSLTKYNIDNQRNTSKAIAKSMNPAALVSYGAEHPSPHSRCAARFSRRPKCAEILRILKGNPKSIRPSPRSAKICKSSNKIFKARFASSPIAPTPQALPRTTRVAIRHCVCWGIGACVRPPQPATAAESDRLTPIIRSLILRPLRPL